MKIVDLSQTIQLGMDVHHTQPEVQITTWSVHPLAPESVNAQYLQIGEHTGTHVDALSHMMPEKDFPSIDEMPLENFIGRACCIDLSGYWIWKIHLVRKNQASAGERSCGYFQIGYTAVVHEPSTKSE